MSIAIWEGYVDGELVCRMLSRGYVNNFKSGWAVRMYPHGSEFVHCESGSSIELPYDVPENTKFYVTCHRQVKKAKPKMTPSDKFHLVVFSAFVFQAVFLVVATYILIQQ